MVSLILLFSLGNFIALGSLIGNRVAKRVGVACLQSPSAAFAGTIVGFAPAVATLFVYSEFFHVRHEVGMAAGAAAMVVFALIFGVSSAALVGAAASAIAVSFAVLNVAIVAIAGIEMMPGVFIATIIGAIAAARVRLDGDKNGTPGVYAGALGAALGWWFFLPLFPKNSLDLVVFLILASVGCWVAGCLWISRLNLAKSRGGNGNRIWTAYWPIILDLVLAVASIFCVIWFLGFTSSSNHKFGMGAWWSGSEHMPLSPRYYLRNPDVIPIGAIDWAGTIVLSTLIPAFLHLSMIIANKLATFFPVTALRKVLTDDFGALSAADRTISAGAAQQLGQLGFWAMVVLIFIVFSSIAFATSQMIDFADYLAAAANFGFVFSDWMFGEL